jgi:hypothetical protein
MRALLGAAVAFLLALPDPTHAQAPPPMESMMSCPMHAQSMQGMQGTEGMQGMGMMSGHGQGMQGPAALLGRPVGPLGLTAEQTAELDAILARAREAALAVLTPEQRASLEAPAAEAEHQH